MSTRRIVTAQWSFTRVLLGPLQLFVAVLVSIGMWRDIGIWTTIQSGVLIFYANSLAVAVFDQMLTEIRMVKTNDIRFEWDFELLAIYVIIPITVMLLSVGIYCVILWHISISESPGLQVFFLQISAVLVAYFSNYKAFSRRNRLKESFQKSYSVSWI